MSLLAAPVVSLLFFSAFAEAVISAPDCNTGWEWSFNSLGQNPCLVRSYMMSTCNNGWYSFGPLQPGSTYFTPNETEASNPCKCNTIGYSLISACTACQEGKLFSWSEYVTNCTNKPPPSSFPNPVPSGTRVPQWALLDVRKENYWNFSKSYATGDTPELGPGTVLDASSSSACVSASTAGSSNTGTSTPVVRHSSNTGAIAGGVIGGIVSISSLVAALLFYLRRRRLQTPVVVFEGGIARHMDQGMVAETLPETMTPLKLYNPDDPMTYPEHRSSTHKSDQMPSISSHSSVYTVAAPLNPKTQTYHGLPIV